MLESMWSSMSSSMQLAQECLEKNEDVEFEIPPNSNLEGLEKFAQTIDNILIRVKVKLVDTTIRLEYLPTDSTSGVAIIIKIKSLGYQNEARNDAPDKEDSDKSDQKTIVFSTHASHYLTLDDISFYSEEFRIGNKKDATKTKSRHNSTTKSSENNDESGNEENESSSLDPFASAISSFSPDNEMFYSQSALSDGESNNKQNRELDDSDDEEGDEIYRSEMILMGVMNNRQEIRINMKLAENIDGPKVSLEVMFGTLILYFTPRQFHMLLLLCDILLNGEALANNDDDNKKFLKEKLRMREEEMKKHIPSYGGNLLNHPTWSGLQPGEDYDCDLKGMQYNNLRPVSSDSFLSSSSSMSSSMQSSASQTTNQSNRHRRAIERDQNADISHYNIRIAGIYVLLLHDDILVPDSDPNNLFPLNEPTVDKLRCKSEHFFNYTSNFISTCSTSDLNKIGAIFNKACDSNHLRIMLAPIILSGEDRRTEKGNRTKLNLSISRAEIKEILDGLTLPILDFSRKDSTSEISKQPEMSIAIEKTFYIMKSSSGRQYIAPRFNMEISLGIETETQFAFDISIFDRIHALFSSPFIYSANSSNNDQDVFSELSPNSQRIVQSKSEIKVLAENLKLILFFPIVDLRPHHDKDRCPYWKRNVRSDFLQIKFKEFKLNSISSIYDIIATEIKFYYSESEKHNPIYFGKASNFENTTNKHYPTKEYPRIIIQIPSDSQIQDMNEEFIREHQDKKDDSDNSDPTSYESIKIKMNLERDSTPFSKKRVCRESDTPHNKGDEDESEILLMPGDKEEMKHFCDNAFKFSKIQVKLDLPIVVVQLKSKHFYEVFYNRIISDILMWESSVPKNKPPEVIVPQKKQPESLMTAGMMDSIYAPFTMCKSHINFESSSSATNSESESENDPVFYSVYERSSKQKSMLKDIYQTDYSNAIALELKIGQGMVTMYAPVRDTQNHVIPGQLGEFVLKTKSTSIFSVNNYHGNSNLGYFCIQSGNLEVYHCGLLPVPIQNSPLRDLTCSLPAWLNATIYPTPRNLIPNDNKVTFDRDMLSLAVQIKSNPEQGLKRVKVSVGIQNATLRYFSSLTEHLWLTQIMDFFDVKEDIVQGYTPYTNLTELHLHLWNSCIDYRPKRYPFRAIANIGTLMISSNIATGSVGCTLRFVAEDGTLSLAPQVLEEKQQDCNKITSLPHTELVCVMELGLFEISLKLSDKVTPLSPKYDLRAAIKDVHLRTCSDSGKALLEFISYLASEGDLYEEIHYDDDQSETSSIMQTNDDELLLKGSENEIPEVTETQQKHVNTLMADAMEESIYIPSQSNIESDEPVDLGAEVFFFPDEDSKKDAKNSNQAGPSYYRKADSYKRRCASEDSISIDSSSYREDEEVFVKRYQPKDEDSGSVNTEMRELLDFERSVMIGMKEPEEDFDPLPQVEMDLGDITKYDLPKQAPETENKKKYSDSDDDFCFVADEERPQYNEIPVLQTDDPIRIVDNHFSAPNGKPDLLKAPSDFPMAVQRYTLCEMSLVWHIYGGRDFDENDRKKEREEREELNRRAFTNYPMSEVYKMGVSYTKGSPSLTLGGSSHSNKLTWKTRGGYCRKHDVLMEIHLNKVRFSHELYPTTTEQASRQVLLITEIEIRDKLAISNINKFLYHPTVGFRTRQGNNHMVVIKALHLRPDRALKTQECCLRISLLPIRLNIDQDSLLFMINFFNELSGGSDLNETKSQAVAKVHQPPVMMVEIPDAAQELQARKMVSENLSLLLNDENKGPKETSDTTNEQAQADSSPIFFRQVIFSPDVPIRLDYQGKRVELSHGPLAGLLMGLGQLQCSEIRLKKIYNRQGILGVDRLINFLIQEWLQDIKKRQLPKILGGVGPMYSLVQLFQGIFDLFYLPFEQYQKDGRIVRGIQRGAQSFTARTALAALEITSRIIYLLQITAETAYDMVSPGPSVRRRIMRKGKRKRINPPQDIREGMANAYYIVKDGIGDTAQTIMQMAALEHDQKGYTGAVGAVMRQIPPTVVRPLVLATQASHQVLGGLTSQLIPDARIEAKEKWKDDNDN
ncbi:hypothetical protein ACKWTF_003650 [Chironomus riparius]